ncbi:MAG: universal stress protein [Chloroflexi bacterium]|nr:universal stress protein [Chloroflexota bacterium]
MYQHVVVPLDGSNVGETALPHARQIAKGCGTQEVTLVYAIKKTKGYKRVTDYSQAVGMPPPTKPMGGKERKAEEYLLRMAQKLQDDGIKVQTKILLGKPAQSIIFYAAHNPCDLIVMATRARSGLARLLRGDIAGTVLKASVAPVLMVRGRGAVPGA